MQLKDLIGISLISIFAFPILLLAIMIMTGVVHLEMGDAKEKVRLREELIAAEANKQEEAEAKQLKAFKALTAKETEVQAHEAAVAREAERLENLKLELAREKDEILRHRQRIEQLVVQDGNLQDKQILGLAEVYGAMKPDDAAPILLSLKDSLVVRILKKIPEARSTSKLMAAIASLDVRRAAHITEMMGRNTTGKSSAPSPKDTAQTKPTPGKA
jgi:flagellar motility protein MotE (MotC chaperone)